jgi:hypothetical protein
MLVSGISCTVNDKNTREISLLALRQVIHFAGVRRFGEAVASRISLEANANKEPAHAFTLHTLIIAVITCGFARWAFGPIFLTDCALIYSRASMRTRHAPAFSLAKIMLWPAVPQRVQIVTGLGRFMRLDSTFYHLNRFVGERAARLRAAP